MLVNAVTVYVKPDQIEAFIAASRKNHEGSRRESGNLRFDVLQSKEDPGRFMLYEVFNSPEAVEHHRTTPHYLEWREAVQPMMAKPREAKWHISVFPEQDAAW